MTPEYPGPGAGGRVVPLPTRGRAIQQEAIDALEDLLQRAKDGKLVELAVAWVTETGGVGTRSTRTGNVFVILGAVNVLHHDILSDCLGDKGDT